MLLYVKQHTFMYDSELCNLCVVKTCDVGVKGRLLRMEEWLVEKAIGIVIDVIHTGKKTCVVLIWKHLSKFKFLYRQQTNDNV